jgi:hypothetical protein
MVLACYLTFHFESGVLAMRNNATGESDLIQTLFARYEAISLSQASIYLSIEDCFVPRKDVLF